MQGIIKVTPEELISTADEFNAKGGQIRTLTQEMVALADSLKSSFEGEAATTYNLKFHELENDMEKMHRMIEKHVNDLKEMAQGFIIAVNTTIEENNSLQGNVIS